MIKSSLITQILDEYSKKRNGAQLDAQQKLNMALENKDILNLFNQINSLTVDISFSEFEGDLEKAKTLVEKQKELQKEMEELLKKQGIKKEDLQPQYQCKKCCDTGFVNNKYCECLKKEISSALIKQSNINFAEVGFEKGNFENKLLIKTIIEIKNSTNVDIIFDIGKKK